MNIYFFRNGFPFVIILTLNYYCKSVNTEYPAKYICYKTGSSIHIDGKLDEDDWKYAPWTSDFVDIEGLRMPKPLYRTRVKMLWDEEYFYVAAELEEPHIWATYDKRDMVIFHENDFEVFIDPDGDTHLYYELEINAKGTVWDLLLGKPYRDGGPAINAWDVKGLQSAVHLYGDLNNPYNKDDKWTIEFAFPWSVLRECATPGRKPADGDQWRINFSRVEWWLDVVEGKYQKSINPDTGKPYPEFNWVWSPQGVIAMHQPETWGYVQFSDIMVGKGESTFIHNPDEDIKWMLREIYYLERVYKEESGSYSSSLEAIGAENLKLRDESFVPELYGSENVFHSSYTYPDDTKTWHIREDGKIWSTDHE